MLPIILITLAVLVVGFLIVVALQPADFRIERTARLSAPPQVVFAQINDFHNWDAWSPWAKLDPAVKNTFEGPSSGQDAIFSWSGNSEVGEGRMTIIESRPNDLIRIKLEFMRPFAATNEAEFHLKPDGDKTAVTWSMTGRHNFLMKGFGLFMNMDKMLGGYFEKGLASLRAVTEKPANK